MTIHNCNPKRLAIFLFQDIPSDVALNATLHNNMKKIKTNPFTHQKINVDRVLNDIKRSKRLQKKEKDLNDAIEMYIISTNFKPKYKFNWLKLLDTMMYLIACGAISFILVTVAIQWMNF